MGIKTTDMKEKFKLEEEGYTEINMKVIKNKDGVKYEMEFAKVKDGKIVDEKVVKKEVSEAKKSASKK